jgi:hypothetical protein
MSFNSHKLGVQILTSQFPRFVIARSDGQYWDGSGWMSGRRHAIVYAHLDLVRADLRMLKRQLRKESDK